MQTILVYGDSLTWGIVPLTRERLPYASRWPEILERELARRGDAVRVVEDCLNGRRTVWEDPFKPGRNGAVGLAQRIEGASPLALVILMLGTNEFQSVHALTPWHVAQGIATLVATIRQAPLEPGMPVPPVLIVAPPPIAEPRGPLAEKFAGGDCAFFDAGTVTGSSRVDGIHLDADQHGVLGRALAGVVGELLG